jgi:hypothetical protein
MVIVMVNYVCAVQFCYGDCHGELRVCSAIKKVYCGLEGDSCGCVVGRTRENAAIPMVNAVIMAWNLSCCAANFISAFSL